jgi:16S rRNA G527 N7-methylase RsmG
MWSVRYAERYAMALARHYVGQKLTRLPLVMSMLKKIVFISIVKSHIRKMNVKIMRSTIEFCKR